MQLTSLRLFITAVLLQVSLWALPAATVSDTNISDDDRIAQELLIKASIAENERLIREERMHHRTISR